MKVAKWGNSLAVRLPASLVEEQNLQEGDEIELQPKGEKIFEISLDERRKKAIERIRELAVPVPADFKFNRDEIYDN